MKQLILLLACALPLFAMSQDKSARKKEKARQEQLSRISGDIGLINGVLNSSFSRETSEGFTLNYARSKSASVYYIFNSAEDRDQVVSYSIGAGFELSQYHLKANSNLLFNDTSTYFQPESTFDYSKNVISAGYLKFPVMLKINKELKDDFYQLSFGIIGGLKVFNTFKQKYTVDNGVYKVRRKGDLNLNPFKLESTFRVGRNNLGLFMNYDFLPLFEKTAHEHLFPFSIGITYNGF